VHTAWQAQRPTNATMRPERRAVRWRVAGVVMGPEDERTMSLVARRRSPGRAAPLFRGPMRAARSSAVTATVPVTGRRSVRGVGPRAELASGPHDAQVVVRIGRITGPLVAVLEVSHAESVLIDAGRVIFT